MAGRPPETAALRRLIQIALNVLPPSRWSTNHAEAVRAGVKELKRRAGSIRQAALSLAVHEELPPELRKRVLDALPRLKWTEAQVARAIVEATDGAKMGNYEAQVVAAADRWRKRIDLALEQPEKVIRLAGVPLKTEPQKACCLCGSEGSHHRVPSYSASYDRGVYTAVDRFLCSDCARAHEDSLICVREDSEGRLRIVPDVDPHSGRSGR